MTAQLDLFGEVAAQLDAEAAARAERADLRARFDQLTASWDDGSPVTWTAPWDCSDGTPEGTTRPARRCPLCGHVEVNEFLLRLNHGMDEQRPDTWTGDGWRAGQCSRQRLLASQAASAAARAAKEATR